MNLIADELADVLLVEDDPGDALVDLDDFVSAIKTIDACFLGLIEPSAAPGHQHGPQHPVLDT
jgi:hypothetical protein